MTREEYIKALWSIVLDAVYDEEELSNPADFEAAKVRGVGRIERFVFAHGPHQKLASQSET